MSDYDEKLIKSLDECGCCRSLDARDRIREQRDLLDECERVMIGVAYYSPEAAAMMENTLAKLKAQEKADESK